MAKVQPRDISPLLQKLRNFLLGRNHITALRFEDVVATRSPPPPKIPDGPCHKINTNYYYSRDVRREVNPPINVLNAKVIEAGEPGKEGAEKTIKNLATPGKIYYWD